MLLASGQEEAHFLSLIGAAEKQSEHPLAEAIVQGIEERGIELGHVQFLRQFQAMVYRQLWQGKVLSLVHGN